MPKVKFDILESTCVPLPFENVDTDQIIPARFLSATSRQGFGDNLFRDWRYTKSGEKNTDFILNDPHFNGKVLVAGKNFGCGSSREHAPIAIKGAGISAVVAESFARIFYRNSINIGLPLIEAKGISGHVFEGDIVEINMDKGILKDLDTSEEFEIKPLPDFMMKIMKEGGLINYLKNHIAEIKE